MPDCRFPFEKYPVVTLAHGAGGRFTQQLIDDVFTAALTEVQKDHDGALLRLEVGASERLVMSTDSYVVKPLFFPGGNIASLAVTGTCNDLAMCGAEPGELSCAWIIEEGFATESLYRLAVSMAETAAEVGARLVTGDTKVVERGHGDGVYLNVTGVGVRRLVCEPGLIRAGDSIIVSGDIGRHGCAIMTQRQDLQLQSPLASDCAHLWPQVEDLLPLSENIHCLRDLTRGGLATALSELSQSSKLQMTIETERVPVSESVSSVCELLGLDPLYTANEGRMVILCSPQAETEVLRILDSGAAVIGRVEEGQGIVATGAFGVDRVLDRLSGEQLPRIC